MSSTRRRRRLCWGAIIEYRRQKAAGGGLRLLLLASFSGALPLRALRGVDYCYALGGEHVAYPVGLGVVLRLLCRGALGEQALDALVVLLFRLGVFPAQLVGLLDEAQAQHAVKVGDGGELGRVVRLGLERVVERRDGERGVEVVVHRVGEFRLELRQHGLVDLPVARA